ncbi:MAG: acyl-CoA/acyl-ACP dehydrogenase [Alphaproteobacteria bacterium]|nr:acyl-CoA/acyl-ACP dehydrogenase [Alphaproteobacteria bacterium]
MNFDFSDEQKSLKEELRKYLAKACPSAEVRKSLEGEQPYSKAVWKGLADMGVLGAGLPEEFGGAGGGYLEVCIVAEELGRALAPVPFSSSILLAAEFLMQAGSEEQKAKYLPKLASGELIGTFAHVEANGPVTPGKINVTGGATLSGTKIPVPDGMIADIAIVSARDGGAGERGISLFIVDLNGKGVTREPVTTIDPTRPQAKIIFNGAAAEKLGGQGDGWALIETVFDRAAVLTAFEQIGGADKALEMARDYALDRMAFGRPIGSFQAIKHMLADMYVSATLARSNAYYAAWALSTGSSELAETAAAARVSATKAFQHCAKNNTQVHGGMGFTWAFDCHLFYKRANILAVNLGSLTQWEDKLIDRLRKSNKAA